MTAIIKEHTSLAARLRQLPKAGGFAAGHIRAETRQKDDGWAAAGKAVIGQFVAVGPR